MPMIIVRGKPDVHRGENEMCPILLNGERIDLPYDRPVDVSDEMLAVLNESHLKVEVVAQEPEPVQHVEVKETVREQRTKAH